MSWPNFFIPGVAKAGTTSLAAYLAAHPEVFLAPRKEPHYFSRIRPASRLAPFFTHVENEAEYRALFRDAGGARAIGEASTSYFWDAEAPRRIAAQVPGARFVILLRDPVERAHSHYLNDAREGIEHRSFARAIDDELAAGDRPRAWGVDTIYLDAGRYARRLGRYREIFGDERLLVLIFEEFVRQPTRHLERVCSFLGVDVAAARRIATPVHNRFARPRGPLARRLLGAAALRRLGRLGPGFGRRLARSLLLRPAAKPSIDPALRERLEDYYAEDVACCRRLLGRELPWGPSTRACGEDASCESS